MLQIATITATLAQIVYQVVTRGGIVLYTWYTKGWLTLGKVKVMTGLSWLLCQAG